MSLTNHAHKKINEQKLQRENKKEKPKDLNKIV